MAKEQYVELLHVLVLTTDQLALLNEALEAAREDAHEDAHGVDGEDDDHAALNETAVAYDQLAAQLLNGWDVLGADREPLFAAIDQLAHQF